MNANTIDNTNERMGTAMSEQAGVRVRRPGAGVGRLVRRLDRERRCWLRPPTEEVEVPTALAWRAGVAEGLRLAQVAIRKGV
jgi:hypothetical protein